MIRSEYIQKKETGDLYSNRFQRLYTIIWSKQKVNYNARELGSSDSGNYLIVRGNLTTVGVSIREKACWEWKKRSRKLERDGPIAKLKGQTFWWITHPQTEHYLAFQNGQFLTHAIIRGNFNFWNRSSWASIAIVIV